MPTATKVEVAPSRRRVLIVTFHYPPDNASSGGLRPLKFTKYLPGFGWNCSVLTVREGVYAATDPGQVADIPAATTVHRTRCFDAKRSLSFKGRYPGFLAVPDRYVSWIPFGVVAALRIVRRERVDAILSTSPVPTVHLIAWLVKLATGIPWVADFRDPWVETEGSEVYGAIRQSVELRLERRVVGAADRVSATTREFADFLRRRYRDLPAKKFVPVYNGYDEDDFKNLADERGSEDFTVVHAGLVDPGYRNPAPVIEAFRRCLDDGELPPGARLDFIGGGPFVTSEAFAHLVADYELRDTVRVIPRIPYREALAKLSTASALLLMQGGDDTRMLIPAKAFEYLRTGRLILAVAPMESATAALVREFAGAFVAEPADSRDIARALAALCHSWKGGLGNVDRLKAGLTRYGRLQASADLARVLNEATSGA